MGRPLRINNTTPKSLKEMSNSEIQFVSHVILSDFVSSSTGTGTISVNPGDTTGLTGIGSFIDTKFTGAVIGDKLNQYIGSYTNVYQQSYSGTFNTTYLRNSLGSYASTFSGFTGLTYVGSYTGNYTKSYPGTYSTLYTRVFTGTFSPGIGGLITNTDYNFYQDLRTVSENLERPLESRSGGIKQQDDDAINEYIISITNAYYLNNGLGNYVLQTSTPSYGGTWTQVSTIVDTNQTSNVNYYLWRRTDQTAPSASRPLKYRLDGNRYDLIEMSNTEIQTLTARFRNRIVDTGVGKFVLQETAPVSGTWVQRGTDVTDTRQDIAVENFALEYTKSYTGVYQGLNYTKTYLGNYTKTYSGVYSRAFVRNSLVNYVSTYSGVYSRAFVRTSLGSYVGSYSGVYSRTFVRTSLGSYVSTFSGFTGPTYVGNYTGNYTRTFTGFFSGFAGSTYVGNYTGSYTGAFTGSFSGPTYVKNYTGNYTRDFTGFFSGPTYVGQYNKAYPGTFVGVYSDAYAGTNYPASVIQSSLETISTVKLWQRTA